MALSEKSTGQSNHCPHERWLSIGSIGSLLQIQMDPIWSNCHQLSIVQWWNWNKLKPFLYPSGEGWIPYWGCWRILKFCLLKSRKFWPSKRSPLSWTNRPWKALGDPTSRNSAEVVLDTARQSKSSPRNCWKFCATCHGGFRGKDPKELRDGHFSILEVS